MGGHPKGQCSIIKKKGRGQNHRGRMTRSKKKKANKKCPRAKPNAWDERGATKNDWAPKPGFISCSRKEINCDSTRDRNSNRGASQIKNGDALVFLTFNKVGRGR